MWAAAFDTYVHVCAPVCARDRVRRYVQRNARLFEEVADVLCPGRVKATAPAADAASAPSRPANAGAVGADASAPVAPEGAASDA